MKHPDNAPGRYWIDCEYCMAFGLCIDAAPINIAYDSTNSFSNSTNSFSRFFVFKQPETEEEERECREALIGCPVGAIHDDG